MTFISLPQIATLLSYVFIIVVYVLKVVKIVKMPVHLRWELYPVPHEKGYKYGGSYLEELEWWKRPRYRNTLRSILFKMRDYFTFPGYFMVNKIYWLGLYLWHIGFYLIVLFHIISFFSAIVLLNTSINIGPETGTTIGGIFFYFTIVVALTSFIFGSIGSVILLIKRLADPDLKNYATYSNYFNYIFFLIVFLSGFAAWYFVDPDFTAYREFWKNLITFKYYYVDALVYVHIMLFSVFLIYLPFTRSTHYITKTFAFFGVFWDDVPIIDNKNMQRKIKISMNKKVTWSASHIKQNTTWVDQCKEDINNLNQVKKK
jgi:nitrate reductase gamma subunit